MSRIPDDFIQQLLDRTDIVEVIERYVPLKKAGASNYQARCPFHNEKTPSFTVSPVKQFYHCFGCGAHGTAITFLMEHAGLGFPDAVRELAQRAGMTVPDTGDDPGGSGDVGRQAREALFQIMELAAGHYRAELKKANRAVDYLRGRGLQGETAALFGLGYAPDDWQGLRRAVPDYQAPAMEACGLVISNEGKRYDRFRDRIMFPIRNEQSRVIAFGGRVLDRGEPKYLNSPETELFHKGRELYGLAENRREIQKADQVVVVEGYMDVVMLAQHGVRHAVATLGTAIGADQVRRLFRLADQVVFAFDGDNAGRRAAWRALENALPQIQDGKRAGFLLLPEGEDPDSFVRQAGEAAFRQRCDQAQPLSEFLLTELKSRTDLSSQEGRVRLAKLAEPHLAQLTQAPLLARALRGRVAELAGLSSGRRLPVVGMANRSPARGRQPGSNRSPWHTLLCAVLHDPRRAPALEGLPAPIDPAGNALRALLDYLAQSSGAHNTGYLVERFAGTEHHTLLRQAAGVAMDWEQREHDVEADLQGALLTLKEQAGQRAIAALAGKKPSEMSDEEKEIYRNAVRIKKPVG